MVSDIVHSHLLGGAVCRDDDHEEPEQVLENPAEDEFRSCTPAAHVKCLVVDVEQYHDAQSDERQGQLAAEHVVELFDRLTRQPVPEPELLDGRLHRPATRVLQHGRGRGH